MKCPLCEDVVKRLNSGLHECSKCGAMQAINPASGNMMWKKNGRVVLADQDVRDQTAAAAARYPDCDFELKTGE